MSELLNLQDETLEAIAVKIAEKTNRADELSSEAASLDVEADQLLIETAMLIKEARRKVEADGNVWSAWANENIKLKESRVRELQRVADADDPYAELERIRAATRDRVARHRAAQKAAEADHADRRYVTSVTPVDPEPEWKSDDAESVLAPAYAADTAPVSNHVEQNSEPDRPALQDRASLAEIGESLVKNKSSIHSFDKVAETPFEAGLVILLAQVDMHGVTNIKSFVTDQAAVKYALSIIGKESEAHRADTDASSISPERQAFLKRAATEAV